MCFIGLKSDFPKHATIQKNQADISKERKVHKNSFAHKNLLTCIFGTAFSMLRRYMLMTGI